MSERLDKAIAALEDAKQGARGHNDALEVHLLDIAKTQAAIAGAEALEALYEYTVRRWGPASFPVDVKPFYVPPAWEPRTDVDDSPSV